MCRLLRVGAGGPAWGPAAERRRQSGHGCQNPDLIVPERASSSYFWAFWKFPRPGARPSLPATCFPREHHGQLEAGGTGAGRAPGRLPLPVLLAPPRCSLSGPQGCPGPRRWGPSPTPHSRVPVLKAVPPRPSLTGGSPSQAQNQGGSQPWGCHVARRPTGLLSLNNAVRPLGECTHWEPSLGGQAPRASQRLLGPGAAVTRPLTRA